MQLSVCQQSINDLPTGLRAKMIFDLSMYFQLYVDTHLSLWLPIVFLA